ncbi:MAG: Ig-like domain-containing protein, partial [Clostridia bacterium]|nr:Ig-like domain-containing protein [Clostridia bacterium]
ASSNIAKFNWMHSGILLDGVKYFARDDGEFNLSVLGHRRWLLDPAMESTGFGLANAQSGNSFVVMHAVDGKNTDFEWDYVAWPAAGAFPTEFMQPDLAWSVSLNEKIYDLAASDIEITLEEENLGLSFSFMPGKESGDGYCRISRENCGSGPCLIFRPNFSMTGFEAYEQNQIWNVRISGLRDTSGEPAEIVYRCEMVSLYPQDVANVEISQLTAEMQPGDTLSLSASVIPAYADDLRVFWSSSDTAVASVDESGHVTALAAGKCTITVSSINGRTDRCEITVK